MAKLGFALLAEQERLCYIDGHGQGALQPQEAITSHRTQNVIFYCFCRGWIPLVSRDR